jgi:hypothetical protein
VTSLPGDGCVAAAAKEARELAPIATDLKQSKD